MGVCRKAFVTLVERPSFVARRSAVVISAERSRFGYCDAEPFWMLRRGAVLDAATRSVAQRRIY